MWHTVTGVCAQLLGFAALWDRMSQVLHSYPAPALRAASAQTPLGKGMRAPESCPCVEQTMLPGWGRSLLLLQFLLFLHLPLLLLL